jgi:hypothetical protein
VAVAGLCTRLSPGQSTMRVYRQHVHSYLIPPPRGNAAVETHQRAGASDVTEP